MTFRQCLDNAESEGVLTRQEAERFRSEYKRLTQALSAEYGAGAEREAARRTFNAFAESAMRKKRNKLNQARIVKRLETAQKAYRGLDGKASPGLFLVNLIEDIGGRAGLSTVTQRHRAHLSRAHAIMTDAIRAFERDFVGRTRNIETLKNVVRELFGADSGDAPAKTYARAWTEASEYLRQRFNAAGGAILKLESWGLPQFHDTIAVGRVAAQDWVDYVSPRLDRTKMLDRDTGAPLDDAALKSILFDMHNTIRTGGWSKVEPSGAIAGTSLANRRLDSRVLHFKSPDDWLDYQGRFGQGDAFAAMMGHLDQMSRDIAQMEILGPNPTATMRHLGQSAEKAARESGDSVMGQVKAAERMLALFNGSANVPENVKIANVVAATREFVTAAKLGFSALSSVTDIKTQRLARRISGVNSNAVIADLFKTLSPSNAATRRLAVRSGLIADGAAHVGAAYARYMGELHARGITRWLADTSLRWNGLSPMTQAHKWTFGMEFMGQAADYADKSIDALRSGGEAEKAFAKTLENYQLADKWDAIRAARAYEPEPDVKFLRAEDVARDAGDDVGLRYFEMIDSQTKIAIPEAMLRARQALHGGAPGTPGNILLGSFSSFKNYPASISLILHHLSMTEAMRAGGGLNGAATGAMFAAQIIAGLTLYGAVAMQLKEIAKGRDPRNMNPASKAGRDFWAQAVFQGGGLGIFGDFVNSASNREGGNIEATIAGAPFGLVSDIASLTIGNAAEKLADPQKDVHFGRDAVNVLRYNTPLANTWWISQAYQRLILDNLQRLADPEADAYFRRQDRSRRRQFGNGYYYAPGQNLPQRGPDFESVLADDPQ